MSLIEEAEMNEYRGYYEYECQYTEKELLLFSKYDFNNAIGLVYLDYEEFMNVDENYDYDISDDLMEMTPILNPPLFLLDQTKPRPKSLLIYDD